MENVALIFLSCRFGGVQVSGAFGQRGDRQNFCDINSSCPHSQGADPQGRGEGLSAVSPLHHEGQGCLHRALLHHLLFLQRKKTDKKGYLALDIVGKGWKVWLVAPAQPGFGL